MDTDLPSALVFVASLLLFAYVSLAQHSGSITFDKGMPFRKVEPLLRWFRHACIIAAALSGLVLANTLVVVGWWVVSLLSFGLLLLLVAIDSFTSTAIARNPARARRLFLPLPRILLRTLGRIPSGVDNGFLNGDGSGGSQREEALDRNEPVITEAELVSLDQRDREMLRSILRLDVTTAREIMVPRLDMVAVGADLSLIQVAEQMVQGGHSRIPVYGESIDQILGIVHSREVLGALTRREPDISLRDLLNPAFFIPETKRLDDLLEELQDKGIQMAIVVDEYGGTEGLLTMEDLLEEIVGEIEDEFSRGREAELVHLPDGGVLVDARLPTDDIAEIFTTTIESADVDTVGGYVYQALGKIPVMGDVVETDHLRIEVVSILGRRIRKLRINRVGVDASTTTKPI